MKKFIKVLLILLLVILLIPFILYWMLHFISPDLETVDDSSLMVAEKVFEGENGYDLYVEASDLMTENRDDIHELLEYAYDDFGTDESMDSEIEKFLDENKLALQRFEKIASADYLKDPNYDGEYSMLVVEGGNKFPELARRYALNVLYEFHEGDELKALNMSFKLVKIGAMIRENNVPIMIYLMASAVESQGLEAMSHIVENGELTEVQIERYVSRLEDFENHKDSLINAYKVEYGIRINNMEEILEENSNGSFIENILMGNNFYFRSNETKQMLADNALELIENVQNADFKNEDDFEINGLFGMLTTSNAMGKVMYMSLRINSASDKLASMVAEYNAILNE